MNHHRARVDPAEGAEDQFDAAEAVVGADEPLPVAVPADQLGQRETLLARHLDRAAVAGLQQRAEQRARPRDGLRQTVAAGARGAGHHRRQRARLPGGRGRLGGCCDRTVRRRGRVRLLPAGIRPAAGPDVRPADEGVQRLDRAGPGEAIRGQAGGVFAAPPGFRRIVQDRLDHRVQRRGVVRVDNPARRVLGDGRGQLGVAAVDDRQAAPQVVDGAAGKGQVALRVAAHQVDGHVGGSVGGHQLIMGQQAAQRDPRAGAQRLQQRLVHAGGYRQEGMVPAEHPQPARVPLVERPYQRRQRQRGVLPRQEHPSVDKRHVGLAPVGRPLVPRLRGIDRVGDDLQRRQQVAGGHAGLGQPGHEVVALPLADAGEEIGPVEGGQLFGRVGRIVLMALVVAFEQVGTGQVADHRHVGARQPGQVGPAAGDDHVGGHVVDDRLQVLGRPGQLADRGRHLPLAAGQRERRHGEAHPMAAGQQPLAECPGPDPGAAGRACAWAYGASAGWFSKCVRVGCTNSGKISSSGRRRSAWTAARRSASSGR